MCSTLNRDLLELRPDTVQHVRSLYDLGDPKKMEEALDIFEDWVKKQNHFLKKKFPRRYLESLIITNKGSIERAKSKIDKLCTLRTILPQFYTFNDIRNDFKNMYSCTSFVPLPKLTGNHCRILSVTHTSNEHFHAMPLVHCYIYSLIYFEYLKMYDYSNGIIYIIDYRDINIMDLVTRLNVSETKQIVTLLVEGYGLRIQGIHIITASKAVETFMKLVKPLFSAKVAERFRVHSSLDTLYEIVPKDILPEEFGGHERSLKDLQNDWIELLSSKESMDYLNETREARVNETHRLNSAFNEHLGVQGTFRPLNVD